MPISYKPFNRIKGLDKVTNLYWELTKREAIEASRQRRERIKEAYAASHRR